MSLTSSATLWKRCVGCLDCHPAFILGNGPTLPEDLTPLDPFFTVGVNRIWWAGYDPTVVMWTDLEIMPDVSVKQADHPDAVLFGDSKAIVFIRDEFNSWRSRMNDLEPFGSSHAPCHEPLNDPSRIAATGNMGTAAAFWAMGLGCRPIYILGMSGSDVVEYDGESQTNFYGVNPAHCRPNRIRMNRALSELLAWDHVYPVRDQAELDALAEKWAPVAREREWYSERFRARLHSG